MNAIKLIFLVKSTNIYSTYWEIEDAYENENEAKAAAADLQDADPGRRYKVVQIPFHTPTDRR